MRILKWIVERARGRAISIESPIGWMPRYEDLDWRGMEDFTRQRFSELMAVDRDLWQQELLSHEALFMNLFYPPYPPPFRHLIGHLMTLTQP